MDHKVTLIALIITTVTYSLLTALTIKLDLNLKFHFLMMHNFARPISFKLSIRKQHTTCELRESLEAILATNLAHNPSFYLNLNCCKSVPPFKFPLASGGTCFDRVRPCRNLKTHTDMKNLLALMTTQCSVYFI